jgi:hypothetical protein
MPQMGLPLSRLCLWPANCAPSLDLKIPIFYLNKEPLDKPDVLQNWEKKFGDIHYTLSRKRKFSVGIVFPLKGYLKLTPQVPVIMFYGIHY